MILDMGINLLMLNTFIKSIKIGQYGTIKSHFLEHLMPHKKVLAKQTQGNIEPDPRENEKTPLQLS